MNQVQDQVSPNNSRQQLLKAASDLMTERLSVDVSLLEIADRSQLNPALVKYYFGNKNGMMVALLEDVLRGPLADMNHMLDLEISPVDKLRFHVRGLIRTYFKFPYVSRLIHAVSQNPETAAVVSMTVTRPLVEAQRRLLTEGISKGYFKDIDVTLFYFIIVGACDHMFFERHILSNAFYRPSVTPDLRDALETTLSDTVLHGLLTPSAIRGELA